MTKWILLPIFLLLVDLVIAQKTESDTLQTLSKNLLDQRISFVQKEGKLEAVLKKISSTYNVKFSYSNDKIENILVKEVVYDSVQLSYFLSSLLHNTGLDYIAVGRMVVIVEEEKKSPPQAPLDSIHPTADSSIQKKKYSTQTHIYSSSTDLSHLPERERRKIKSLYDEEIFYANRNRRYMGIGSKDTTEEPDKPIQLSKDFIKDEKDYYISAMAGWMKFTPRLIEESGLDYKKDLSFKYDLQPTIQYGVRLGVIRNHWMIGTGAGYHRFSLSGEGKGYFAKGQSGKVDTVIVSFKDTYSIFSIPAEIIWFTSIKKIVLGTGAKLGFDFIKNNSVKNKFENYFNNRKDKDEDYLEKDNTFVVSASVNVLAGYSITQNMILAAGLEYQYYLNPHSKNSIYTFYPNAVIGRFSFFYLLGKSDIKNLFNKD